MGFHYIASPYTRWPGGREEAFETACYVAAYLMTKGVKVYCPIAHTHPIAEIAELDPIDHDFWIAQDRPLMESAQGLIVCTLPGWEVSRGISAEIEYFKSARKPIIYWEPMSTIPEELL